MENFNPNGFPGDTAGLQDDSTDRMLRTINNLNKLNESTDPNAKNQTVAAKVEEDKVDPNTPEPVDNTRKVDDLEESAAPGGTEKIDSTIEEEYEFDEDDKVDECDGYEEEVTLSEKFLKEYMGRLQECDDEGAKELAESQEYHITEGQDDDGDYVIAEKFVIKVQGGKKVKKKVRTRKMRRTAKQKASLRKARRVASTTGKKKAAKKRKKAMKIRRKLGLSNSAGLISLRESFNSMFSAKGFSILEARQLTNEAIRLVEAETAEEYSDLSVEIINIFNNKGFEVRSVNIIGESDDIVECDVVVVDNDTTIYLDELVDEMATTLDAGSVEAEEPQTVDNEEGIYTIKFFIDISADDDFEDADDYEEQPELEESYNRTGRVQTIAEALGFNGYGSMNESVLIKSDSGYIAENSSGSDVKYTGDPEKAMVFENDGDAEEYLQRYKIDGKEHAPASINECDVMPGIDDKKNESVNLTLPNHLSGKYKAITPVNPNYLNEGIVYDASENTVFKILESAGNGQFTVDILETKNENLRGVKGAMVTLTESYGNYILVNDK